MSVGRFLLMIAVVPTLAGWAGGVAGFTVAFLGVAGFGLASWQKARRKKAAYRAKLEAALKAPVPKTDQRQFFASTPKKTPPPLPDPEPPIYRIDPEDISRAASFASAAHLSNQVPETRHASITVSRTPSPTVTATRPPNTLKLQWVPPTVCTEIKGRAIPGMIYASDSPLGYDGEPSAICRSLSADRNPVSVDELPYYPSYGTLTPSQRGFYLDWLARGRRDTSPDGVPTGYLFLFFYGIERRILIDGDRDPAMWFEVFELLRLYGLKRKSRSISSYFGDFLHFTSYAAGSEGYANVCQTLLDLQGMRISETSLALALANRHRRGETMDWALAHLVAMNLEESRRSVVTERTGDAFKSMFMKRFQAIYPSGMPLKTSKRDHTVRYQTGNATLFPRYYNYGGNAPDAIQLKVPGVISLKSQFKGLSTIWNECIEDLSGYSRAVARLSNATQVTNQDLLKAHLSLPPELRHEHKHPFAEAFQQTLESCPESNGVRFMPVTGLAALLDIPQRAVLTQKQSEDVAALVESLGYTLAPHPRLLNLPLSGTQEIAVIRFNTGTETPELGGMLRLLYLAVLIASADGVIDQAELAVFHRSSGITDNFGMTQLMATEAALVRDTQIASKQLSKIARSVPAAQRMAVFKLLVHIACCDDVLSSDENRLLKKIAKTFQLPDGALDDVLTEDSTFHTVTVTDAGTKSKGEIIPPPPGAGTAPAFSLDMDRIAALTAETAEVVSILSKALAEESHDEPETAPSIGKGSPLASSVPVGSIPEWAQDLDERYHSAFLDILSEPGSESLLLAAIASRHHLMTDDLLDGINTWSDEALGDFLITDNSDGTFSIQHDLIPDT